ncbi:MAG: helix-turn-helix domain-containing protein [Planktotalea sp.]
MDIEMSPGAFRLLVELCRMANRTGECWPSLGQLSDRIGRSKAAISGYIAELRALDLVATLNQRMANGYNYRLKYSVTFWQSWRAQISARTEHDRVQKTECTVQPVERRVNSKNQNHLNQPQPSQTRIDSTKTKLVSVFSQWSQLAKNAPFPSFNAQVPQDLITKTQDCLVDTGPLPLNHDRLQTDLERLWNGLGISISPVELSAQSHFLHTRRLSQAGMDALATVVRSGWQTHWKKPPNQKQFESFLSTSQKQVTDEGLRKVLAQFLRRWEITQNKLQRGTPSLNLSEKHAA